PNRASSRALITRPPPQRVPPLMEGICLPFTVATALGYGIHCQASSGWFPGFGRRPRPPPVGPNRSPPRAGLGAATRRPPRG
nr:hypothetical protein [Tanacetum cinerariifolium]